jgi:cytochrome c oxidase cbb3-type subunit 2
MQEIAPLIKEEDGIVQEIYPPEPIGIQEKGKAVYISEGCYVCHTMMVRGEASSDVARGWGIRKSVPRDYLARRDEPIGVLRLGPDLSNYGADFWRSGSSEELASKSKVNESRIYQHLYDPRKLQADSIMPSYKHLFSVPKYAAEELGRVLSPSEDAKALAAYLISRSQHVELPEAGMVSKSKK